MMFLYIVLLSPFLAMYGIRVSSFTLLDLFLLIFIFISITRVLLYENTFLRIKYAYIFYYPIIIILISLIHFLFIFDGENINSMARTIRFLIYFSAPFLFYYYLPNFNTFIRIYTSLAVVVIAFLLFQYFSLYFFGYYPKGYISISYFPILREELIKFTESITGYESWIRARSFLGEPSQIGLFVGLSLFLRVYYYNKFISKVNLFLIFGLVLSFSTTSLAFIVSSYIYYLLRNKKILLLFAIFLFILIWVTGFFSFDDGRVLKSLVNRIGRESEFLKIDNFFILLFGYGYTEFVLESWMPSTQRILLSYGIIGIVVFYVSIFNLTNFYSFTSICFLSIYIMLSNGTEVPLSYFNLIYISVFLYIKDKSLKV